VQSRGIPIFWETYAIGNPYSGIGNYAWNLFQQLTDLKSKPVLLSGAKSFTSFHDLKTQTPLRFARVFQPQCSYYTAQKLLQKENRQGVFHALANYNLPLLTRSTRLRFIVTVHDLIPLLDAQKVSLLSAQAAKALAAKAFAKADEIICVSDWTKDTLEDMFPKLKAKKHVIRHGFDPLSAEEFKRTINEKPQAVAKTHVISVGRFEKYKRFDLLVEFLKIAKGEIKLTVVTDDRGRKFLHEKAGEDIKRRHLEIFTEVSRSAMAALYASAHVCILPSLYEGFCLPALEAVNCGTPVVFTKGNAIEEWIPKSISIGLEPNAHPKYWIEAADQLKIQSRSDEHAIQLLQQLQEKLPSWKGAAQGLLNVYNNS
jgi:glycosyltransferase involved in cell wall biosynthesis